MKTLSKISDVSYVSRGDSGDKLKRFIIPQQSKLIPVSDLSGIQSERDLLTFLSAVERSLVTDFTSYYDKLDALHGCSYDEIKKCNVTFSDGSSIIYSGSDVQETGVDDIYCIRQVSLGNIRSFELIEQSKKNSECIGADMTKAYVAVSTQSWLYLEELTNRVLGFKYVTVNPVTLKVDFSEVYVGKEKETAEGIYLLLSEIVCLGEGRKTPLYVLVSALPSNSDVKERLFDVLSNIKYDCQVFVP